MATSEAFRAKLREDYQKSMRPSSSSIGMHLSRFMPIGIFVDDLCAPFMDIKWILKIKIGTSYGQQVDYDSKSW